MMRMSLLVHLAMAVLPLALAAPGHAGVSSGESQPISLSELEFVSGDEPIDEGDDDGDDAEDGGQPTLIIIGLAGVICGFKYVRARCCRISWRVHNRQSAEPLLSI